MLSVLPFDAYSLFACAAAVLAAYVIFGLTSFGAPLVSAPVLAHFLPLPLVVPLQSTLDLIASLVLGGKERKQIDWREMKWLLAPMLIGMLLGTTLLIGLPQRVTLLALGAFVMLFGIAGLTGRLRLPPVPRPLAFVILTIGGVLSALFSAGGPLYVMYLTNRIADPTVLRSTIAATALLSAVLRVAVFTLSGLMAVKALWITAAVLLPALFAGVFFGRWLQRVLSANINRALIYALLVAVGASLVWRFA